MITVACVRNGTAYPVHYVERLRNMVLRHADRPVRIICLTDRPDEVPEGVEPVDIAANALPTWWPKMLLLDPMVRGEGRCVYLDLDTVVCGPLAPLFDLEVEFGICANFARAAGALNWPCRFGSCVMSFADGWGFDRFARFWTRRDATMAECGRYGDQMAYEMLVPDAAILQERLPAGFFMNKRDFGDGPGEASVLIFGGAHRPHNTPHRWARELWQ